MLPSLHLCLDDGQDDPTVDTALSRAILQRVDAGELPATLRLSRPGRIVAFSRQDARSDGFEAAVTGARSVDFAPVLRLAGGRAAVFTPSTIAFAWAVPADVPVDGVVERFSTMAAALTSAISGFGIDARIGEVPGEYCAGRWSVNVAGRRKVAGIGQRLLRHSAHTGGVVVVADAAAVNRALDPVYAAMDVAWEPDVTGAIGAYAAVSWQDVRSAIAAAFGQTHDLVAWQPDEPTLDLARSFAHEHRL